ncbi:MAG: DNA adenine methylase, partial [Candidatus Dormibacteria bacterium]
MQSYLPIDDLPEDPAYFTDQLVTCIGNKRALLGPIAAAVSEVRQRLGKARLRILDAFSGSGVVARLMKQSARELVVNDIEAYARVLSECYLSNRSVVDLDGLRRLCCTLENESLDDSRFEPGFIERLYSPRDEHRITQEDRVFYTQANARRLDRYRRLIGSQPRELQNLLLGPMLSEASIHANTAGVFKGFYNDRHTGLGRYGGSGSDALLRILGPITMKAPLLSRVECSCETYQMPANELVTRVGDFDLAYFDPPYNQHPYGSNYFMLNLLVDYVEPTHISKVSGIPIDWRRSDYNTRSKALKSLARLIRDVDARFVLLSYNDEGFI